MNLEHERSQLAREAHNAGYVLHRLAGFAKVLDQSPPPTWSVDSIDDLATQLQEWAIQVSADPTNRTLAKDLAVRTERQRAWRQRRSEIIRDQQEARGGLPPSRPC